MIRVIVSRTRPSLMRITRVRCNCNTGSLNCSNDVLRHSDEVIVSSPGSVILVCLLSRAGHVSCLGGLCEHSAQPGPANWSPALTRKQLRQGDGPQLPASWLGQQQRNHRTRVGAQTPVVEEGIREGDKFLFADRPDD